MTTVTVNSIVQEINGLSRAQVAIWDNESHLCGNIIKSILGAAVVVLACGLAGIL